MARVSSLSKVPVAARAIATAPTSSMATHGVPPGLTRASAPGAKPSRARPNSTRGVTKMLPLSDASTTSSASAATTAPAFAPTIALATSAATRFDAAICASGSTCRKAALSSKYRAVTIAMPPRNTRGSVRPGFTTSSAIFAASG